MTARPCAPLSRLIAYAGLALALAVTASLTNPDRLAAQGAPDRMVDFSAVQALPIQGLCCGAGAYPTGDLTLGGRPFRVNEGNNATVITGPVLRVDVDRFGVTEVHTLINTIFAGGGTTGWVEFFGDGGAYLKQGLVYGVDVRDHNAGSTPINGTSTTEVFRSGAVVLDMQRFILPAAFQSQTLTHLIVSDNPDASFPMVTGVTVQIPTPAGTVDLRLTTPTLSQSVVLGQDFTVDFALANAGAIAATAPQVLSDPLPSGVELVSSTGAGRQCQLRADRRLVCTSARLLPNAGTYAKQLTLRSTVATQFTLRFTADAALESEPTPASNVATVEITVQPTADTSVQLILPDSGTVYPKANRDYTYTFRVTNNGPAAAPRISLAHEIPEGLEFTSLSTSLCTHAAGVVACDIEGLGIGSVNVGVTTRAAMPRSVVFLSPTVLVSVQGASDPNLQNNGAPASPQTILFGPGNDDIADAAVIAGTIGSIAGLNQNGSREAQMFGGIPGSEPFHDGNGGQTSVWFRWQTDHTAQATFDTLGSGFDTVLGVYFRPPIASDSSLWSVASNDDFDARTSQVSFEATAGVVYYIAVDGFLPGGENVGALSLNWSQAGAVRQEPVPQIITAIEPRWVNTSTAPLTMTIRGSGFSDQSRVQINRTTCRPMPAGVTPGGDDCVQTMFSGDSTQLEARIPANYLREPRLLSVHVRTANLLSEGFRFEVVKYVQFEVPAGGTGTASLTLGEPGKPAAVTNITVVCSDGPCLGTFAGHAADRPASALTLLPGRVIGNGLLGAALLAPTLPGVLPPRPESVVLETSRVIGDYGMGLISDKGFGVVAKPGAPLISDNHAVLIGIDAGTLIGNDGGTLIGIDGGTRPVWTDDASRVRVDAGTTVAARASGRASDAGRANAAPASPAPTQGNTAAEVSAAGGDRAAPPATVDQHGNRPAAPSPPPNGGWFLVRSSGNTAPPITATTDAAGRGIASFSMRLDDTSTPRASELTTPTLFALVADMPIVQLENVTTTVTEAANGSVTITVTRSGNLAVPITVRYQTVDGSARAGVDYIAVSGTLVFAAGETSKTVTIAVLDDAIGEGDETIFLQLSVADGSTPFATGSPVAYTITIVDDIDPLSYSLAEGATGTFFDLDIAVANPNAVAAPIVVTFFKPDGTTAVVTDTLLPTSRRTIRVDGVAGVGDTAVSTTVASTDRVPLLVERTMYWDANYYGGHTENAGSEPGLKWYFGEGSQGFFDTYVLLANGNAAAATVTVRFLVENGSPVTKTYTVAGTSRFNVYAGAVPELVGRSFSMVVDSDLPISAERAMYFGTARFFDGGHESAGVGQPATSWFHAEGATGDYFDTYLLVGNPNDAAATVTFTYLLDTGQVVTTVKTVPANARLTVEVEAEDPLLRNAAVSTTVTSDLPVISERSMYWPGAFSSWFEAHNSFGVTETATGWGLAEGIVGGAREFQTYILLANPNNTAATVTLTFLRTNGSTVVKTFTVGATSRFNVAVNSMVPELANESFGTVIQSEAGKPIAVERALYWNALGVTWAGGTNAAAVKLP